MKLNRREALFLAGGAILFAATRPVLAASQSVLRFAPHAALRVLDPVTTSAYVTRNHAFLVYDNLFSMDSKYTPQPQMVDHWTILDDGLTWDFTLRDGLEFHDGTKVTSADVIASIKRWWQKDVIGVRLQAATNEITATDDKSFRIVLKEPFGIMLEAFARPSSIPLFIMPKRIADLPPTTVLEEVVGSGPFRFVQEEFRPGVGWTYVKNEKYVPRTEPADGLAGGKVPNVDRIEAIWFPSPDTAMSALQSGELDIMESINPDHRINFTGSDILLQPKGSPTISTIRFNWAQPPFNDIKLRQAVQAVATQQDYLDVVVGDPDAYRICPALFGCNTPLETDAGFIDSGIPDIERAKKLVEESSYNGEKVVIITPGDLASFSALAPMTQQLLSSIGIQSEIQTMEWSAFLTRRANSGPVSDGGWNLAHAVFDGIDLISPLGNMNFDARGKDGYTGFIVDPETETLKTRYQQESDPEKQKEIAAEMQKRAYEQVFYIPLGTYDQYTAIRPEFANYVSSPVAILWGVGKS